MLHELYPPIYYSDDAKSLIHSKTKRNKTNIKASRLFDKKGEFI